MEKVLIIIRGVQGSGKSTLAEMILGWADPLDIGLGVWVHYEADMFFINPETKEYKFEGEKLPQAHRWCEHKVNEAMKEGKKIIVSNTFTQKKEYKVYLEMAEQHGYQIQEIICKGRFKNVHGVAEEKVEAKRKAFEY